MRFEELMVSVSKLDVGPGDVLVFRTSTDAEVSNEVVRDIERWLNTVGLEGQPTLVISRSADVTVEHVEDLLREARVRQLGEELADVQNAHFIVTRDAAY